MSCIPFGCITVCCKFIHSDNFQNYSMKFLVQFYAEWIDFRFAEFDSLLTSHGLVPAEVYDQKPSSEIQHFFTVNLPDENVAKAVCSRAVLIKSIHELWCDASDFNSLVCIARKLQHSFLESHTSSRNSWSVHIDSFGKSFQMSEKQNIRSQFDFIHFLGPVNLTSADVEMWIILDCSKIFDTLTKDNNNYNVPSYLGRLVAKGGMRNERLKFDLKKRLYLGPTSLDESLALILANICNVQKGTVAYDPFVGTASILVALSHFGAFCLGSDIDPRVLRGEMYAGKADRSSDFTKRDIFENFKNYCMQPPELVRMDNHLLDSHFSIAKDGFVDVIITDPPYGIRAGAKKTGSLKIAGSLYDLISACRQGERGYLHCVGGAPL